MLLVTNCIVNVNINLGVWRIRSLPQASTFYYCRFDKLKYPSTYLVLQT